MTPAEFLSDELADVASALRTKEEPFAFATIVRTAGATAAKPGAKAVLSADGTILHGWLGGGCTRSAVKKATIAALQSGQPQLVSVAPEELLAEKGVSPGDEVAGTRFARNGCPSKGSVDIFIEPCLPMPQLVVLGTSPVALALVALAPTFHWAVVTAVPDAGAMPAHQRQAIVIATQGQGDMDALKTCLVQPALHVAFVGSARKFATLAEKLIDSGIDAQRVNAVKAPAGLDLGAVTPEEIALSILADLVQIRRAPAGVADA
ncbi:XdhC family protein [Yoonia sp. F2084L]|uniref:XdhC family protein n=1 Tax=Yoonia sp. F2084L TaxID=2926419 RepID=UPI001FF4E973|nr:XdhC family protein [Yoonia sp. F2084L]MCK0095975.1 XdhC family protein [Yoonia sp. F2084L]